MRSKTDESVKRHVSKQKQPLLKSSVVKPDVFWDTVTILSPIMMSECQFNVFLANGHLFKIVFLLKLLDICEYVMFFLLIFHIIIAQFYKFERAEIFHVL